jgi:hypothetical protein
MVQVVPHKITLEEEILQESNPNSQSSLVEKEAHNKPGRPARKYFRFHHLHPLHGSHAQVLRSKQNTLIINGYAPKYPGPRPLLDEDCETTDYDVDEYHQALKRWTIYGRKFAEFYIANFMPHDCFYGNSFPDSTSLSFESLSERIEQMEKSPRLIDRMRLEAMMTYICGFRTDSKKHKLLDNFRHKCTTRWTDDERRESDNIHRNMGVASKFQESTDAEVQEDSRVLMEFFNPSKTKGIRGTEFFVHINIKQLLTFMNWPPSQQKT